jgi:hypothetical protein
MRTLPKASPASPAAFPLNVQNEGRLFGKDDLHIQEKGNASGAFVPYEPGDEFVSIRHTMDSLRQRSLVKIALHPFPPIVSKHSLAAGTFLIAIVSPQGLAS